MDLIQLLVAKGWAEYGISLNTVQVALANVRNTLTIRPMSGYSDAFVYKIIPMIPKAHEVGRPTVTVGSATTSDQTNYSSVVTYNVPSITNASLSEVMLDTNNWAGTQWRLTISGNVMFTGQVFNSSPSFPWYQMSQLPEQDSTVSTTDRRGRVVLSARSAAGASITAYGAVTAKEFLLRVFDMDIVKAGNIVSTTVSITANLVDNGIDVWAYITREDPLTYVVTNQGGLDGESFAVQTAMINTDRQRAAMIKQFMAEYGSLTPPVLAAPVGGPLYFR